MQMYDFPAERRAPVSPPPPVLWPSGVQGRELCSPFLGLHANEGAASGVVSARLCFSLKSIAECEEKKILCAFNFSEGDTISEFLVCVILAQHQVCERIT